MLYSSYFGGVSDEFSYGIAVHSETQRYMFVGLTRSDDMPVTSTAFKPTKAAMEDAFVAVFVGSYNVAKSVTCHMSHHVSQFYVQSIVSFWRSQTHHD